MNRPLNIFMYLCMYIGVEQCWKRLMPILLFMAAVIYFLILIVWIVAFIEYTRGKFDISILVNKLVINIQWGSK